MRTFIQIFYMVRNNGSIRFNQADLTNDILQLGKIMRLALSGNLHGCLVGMGIPQYNRLTVKRIVKVKLNLLDKGTAVVLHYAASYDSKCKKRINILLLNRFSHPSGVF